MKGIVTLITILFFTGAWSQDPLATFDISETEICMGQSITFTDNSTSTGNIISWEWTFSGGSPPTFNTQGPHTVYFYGGGTPTIKLKVIDDNGNFDEKTISVIVHQNPSAYAGNDGPTCTGSGVVISASGSGNSFSWSGPNGMSSASNDISIPHISISEFGTYTVVVTNSFGCSSTASTDVVVGPGPQLTMSGTDVSCFGYTDGIASVVATGGVQPYHYNWSPSGSNTSIATNLPSGMQYLSITDENNCFSEDSVFIDEPTEIMVSPTSAPTKCYVNDGTAMAMASGGTPGYSYSWAPSGVNTQTATTLGPGEHVVTVKDANNCLVNDTVLVEVSNAPMLSVVDSSDITCFGENDGKIEAEINGGSPDYIFNWSPTIGDTNIASGLSPGVYSVSGTDDKGCKTDTIEVTITEPEKIAVDTTVLGTTCGYRNGEIVLDVSGGTGSYSYLWSTGTDSSNVAVGLSVGNYNVTVSDSLGCSESLVMDIGVVEPFDLDVIPNVATVPKGDSVAITIDVDPNISIGSITWTPSEGLSCNDCPDPVAVPSDTTVYVVEVMSTDGCSSKDSVLVIVKFPCGDVFVPTIFSPDGDGVNDFECIKGRCIVSCDFTIFNRWGEAVFQTTDNKECWDGTFKGKKVESGVYVYRLIVNRENGDTINKTGNITVVR